jgi:apolipoprotein D and lipocalin family protein
MKSRLLLMVSIGLMFVFVVGTKEKIEEERPLRTVTFVDLSRYVGRWYEIARLPNSFQKDCASDVMATYTLRDDGKITVLNQCRKASGEVKKREGTAKVADKTTNAKLKVTFFWPLSGNYWILELGPNYEYAVVGEPKRKNLWILSREPRMDEELYRELLERAAAQGFDTNRVIKTPHTVVTQVDR